MKCIMAQLSLLEDVWNSGELCRHGQGICSVVAFSYWSWKLGVRPHMHYTIGLLSEGDQVY